MPTSRQELWDMKRTITRCVIGAGLVFGLALTGCDKLAPAPEPPRPTGGTLQRGDEEPVAPVAVTPVDPPVVAPPPQPMGMVAPTLRWGVRVWGMLIHPNRGPGSLFKVSLYHDANPHHAAIRLMLRDSRGQEIPVEAQPAGNEIGIEHFIPGASQLGAPYYAAVEYFNTDSQEWVRLHDWVELTKRND